jgi:hypothetical protein
VIFENSGIWVFFFSDNSLLLICKTKTIVPFTLSLFIIVFAGKGATAEAGAANGS